MRLPLVILFIASILGSILSAQVEAPKKPKTVAFKTRAYKVGDQIVWSTKDSSVESLKMSMNDEMMIDLDIKMSETLQSRVLVTKVDPKTGIQQFEITIGKWERKEPVIPTDEDLESGDASSISSRDLNAAELSIVGKSYRVDASQSPAAVVSKDGKKVSDDVASAVRKASFIKGTQLRSERPFLRKKIGNEMKIGSSFSLKGLELVDFLGTRLADDLVNDEEVDAAAASMIDKMMTITCTLKSTRRVLGNEVAVFDFEAKLSTDALGEASEAMGMTVEGKQSGTFHVGVNDGLLYRMDIKGDTSVAGGQESSDDDEMSLNLEIAGESKMTQNQQAIYTKAK